MMHQLLLKLVTKLKSKNTAKPKAAKKKVEAEESSDNAGTTNLGALLKAKLDSKK
jgi:small subunit ribosomal protein S1